MRVRALAVMVFLAFVAFAVNGGIAEDAPSPPESSPTPSADVEVPTHSEIRRAALRLAEAARQREATDEAVTESAKKMLEH